MFYLVHHQKRNPLEFSTNQKEVQKLVHLDKGNFDNFVYHNI